MKKASKIITAVLAIVMAFSVVGCGGKDSGVKVDPNKEQIYIYAVTNGMGYKWAEKFAEEFNALPENQDFQVIAQTGSMDLTTTLKSRLIAKNTEINIYFGCQSAIATMIDDGLLLDLSDVYDMKVDGDDTTIKDKTFNFEIIEKAFTTLDGEGIYAVPYSSGVGGMLFDYKYFLEQGFLNYVTADKYDEIVAQCGSVVKKEGRNVVATADFGNYKTGDKILTPGKDGKYGTYDDGQVTTYAEFKTLLKKIMNTNDGSGAVKPFIYTTQYNDAYTQVLYNAIIPQYMGYENFYNFMSLNGTITDADGNVQATFTAANGNEAYQTQLVQDAFKTAYGFYNDTIMGKVGEIDGTKVSPSQMLHPSSYNTSGLSNTDAQSMFITAPVTTSQDTAAFLIEGSWWEDEATGYFKGLESYSEPDDPRGYGKREYRYYMIPDFEGQVNTGKSYIACQDDGIGVLCNNLPKKYKVAGMTDAKYIQKCKEFIAYTLSNKSLEYYTATEGSPRPYNYTLSEESYNALTPFQRNVWDITHDTENVQVIYPNIMNNLSLVRSYGGLKTHNTNKVKKGDTNIAYTCPYAAFKDTQNALSVTEYINGINGYISEQYSKSYNLVKDYVK